MPSWYAHVHNGEWTDQEEIMITDPTKTKEQAIAGLPTNCGVGSCAYNGVLSIFLLFNGTSWEDPLAEEDS